MKKPGEHLYPDDEIEQPQHNGRGALSNASSRYDDEKKIRTTDGWDIEEDLPPLRTTLFMARWRVETHSPRDPSNPSQWSDAGLDLQMKAHIDARIDQCFTPDMIRSIRSEWL